MTTRRVRQLEQGNTTEAVILFPVLLGLVFLILQAGIWAHARGIAIQAAREGALAEATYQSSSSAESATYSALKQAGDGVLTSYTVTSTSTGQNVTVTVTGTSLSLVPGMDMPAIEQTVSVPRESYVP